MQEALRILHIADVHFGKKGRERDIRGQLEKVVGFCLKKEVEILLISGDLFDRPDLPLDQKEAFLKTVSPLLREGVRVLAICGNHDRGITGLKDFPFYQEPHKIAIGDLLFYLFPFDPQSSWQMAMTSMPLEREAPCQVVICHGSFVSSSTVKVLRELVEDKALYWPIIPDEVRGLPIDYLALGHYHNPLLWKEGETICAYPGTIEPLSFKENGPRMAYLLIWDKDLKVEPVDLGYQTPFVVLDWCLGVDVTERDLGAKLRELTEQKGFFKVRITGFCEDLERLKFQVGELPERVKVEWAALDLGTLKGDLLLEKFVHLVKDRYAPEEALELISYGLKLLKGHVDQKA